MVEVRDTKEQANSRAFHLTNAFVFDSYNHERCVRQHSIALRELVLEIAAAAVGADPRSWLRPDGNAAAEEETMEGLPLSFTARGSKPCRKRRRRDNASPGSRSSSTSFGPFSKDHEPSSREAFQAANRRRVCVCVPAAGLKWWDAGIAPCGRVGQQCGCRRSWPAVEIGSMWEVKCDWRLPAQIDAPNSDCYVPAVVLEAPATCSPVREGHSLSPSPADGRLTSSHVRVGLFPTSSPGARNDSGTCVTGEESEVVTVPLLSLRAPRRSPLSPQEVFAEFAARAEALERQFGVLPCVCSVRGALSQPVEEQCGPDSLSTTSRELLPDVHEKFWNQRYRYFSRFDEGIWLDYEGWYSSCPEAAANHVARRVVGACARSSSARKSPPSSSTCLPPTATAAGVVSAPSLSCCSSSMLSPWTSAPPLASLTILDAFTGCGANAIALALHPSVCRVVTVDVCESKVRCAKHNAAVYGVADKIEFVQGDASSLLEHWAKEIEQASEVSSSMTWPQSLSSFLPPSAFDHDGHPLGFDCVCLGPPWGGPDYLAAEVFDVEAMIRCPLNMRGWLALARRVSRNGSVTMMVPRSTNPEQLANIAALVPPAEIESGGNYPCEVGVEVEDVAINYKVKMKVAYYGASFRSKIQQSLAKRTKPFAQE